MPQAKPVILLAFADSRNDLPQVQEERRVLDDLLSEQFNVEQKDAATHRRIEDTFRSYGRAVRIFHFGGHANGQQLALLASEGQDGAAYVKGVAQLVGRQQGVELVFLNGCSTQGQVASFLGAKIPAVIATTAPVCDKVARQFAELFYKNFIGGSGRCPLHKAFDDAKAQLESRYPSYPQMYSRDLLLQEEAFESRFPYELHLRNDHARNLCCLDLELPYEGEPAEEVPPLAHLLIDREDPNEDFKDSVKDGLIATRRRPIACLVHGEEVELPLKLCQRFRAFTLREAFRKLDEELIESHYESKFIEMPRRGDFKRAHKAMDRIKESLKIELDLEKVSAREIRGLSGEQVIAHLDPHLRIVLLQHNLYAEEWDKVHSPQLLREYLGDFWNLELPDTCPDILLLFNLQYPPKRGLLGLKPKPNTEASQAFQQLAEVLDLLPSVERLDLRKWNDKYAPDDPGLTDRIFKKDKPMPMQEILPQLEAIVRKARKSF